MGLHVYVSMCWCMFMPMCARSMCQYVSMCVCVSIHVCMLICAVHVCRSSGLPVYVCVLVHAHAYVGLCVSVYLCMCTCICAIHVCMHAELLYRCLCVLCTNKCARATEGTPFILIWCRGPSSCKSPCPCSQQSLHHSGEGVSTQSGSSACGFPFFRHQPQHAEGCM